MKRLLQYKNTLSYILLIVVINTLFSYLPLYTVWGCDVSPMEIAVGIVYVLRDFAQREINHKVIIAMLIGSVLSYVLADKAVAIASIASFLIAEFIDWGIYSFSKKPLAQRILWSASISAPIDSIVFLYFVHQLNWLSYLLLTVTKIVGIVALWYMWRIRDRRQNTDASIVMISQ